MSGWAVAGPALWVITVVPLLAFLAAGNRRARRQYEHRARALKARRHAASWGRQTSTRPRPKGHRR